MLNGARKVAAHIIQRRQPVPGRAGWRKNCDQHESKYHLLLVYTHQKKNPK